MSANVTLYVESGSATSEQTRAAMDSAGIIYELVAVTASDYPLQAVGTSYPTAPVTVVDGESWDGYRPDLIARLAADQALEMYQVRRPIRWTSSTAKAASDERRIPPPAPRHRPGTAALLHTRRDRPRDSAHTRRAAPHARARRRTGIRHDREEDSPLHPERRRSMAARD